MNATQPAERRRVHKRYSAADRERLIQEQAQSGLTKKAFCTREGIALPTFHSWRQVRLPIKRQPTFAEVELSGTMPVAFEIEVLLPTGARVGIRHHGRRKDLVALIRGVSGC
jgi:hypothetical protein